MRAASLLFVSCAVYNIRPFSVAPFCGAVKCLPVVIVYKFDFFTAEFFAENTKQSVNDKAAITPIIRRLVKPYKTHDFSVAVRLECLPLLLHFSPYRTA